MPLEAHMWLNSNDVTWFPFWGWGSHPQALRFQRRVSRKLGKAQSNLELLSIIIIKGQQAKQKQHEH